MKYNSQNLNRAMPILGRADRKGSRFQRIVPYPLRLWHQRLFLGAEAGRLLDGEMQRNHKLVLP